MKKEKLYANYNKLMSTMEAIELGEAEDVISENSVNVNIDVSA